MKMLPYLLINLVMVGGGLVVYDQLKADDAPRSEPMGGVDAVDLAGLEERVLERLAASQPSLQAAGTDPRVLDRLASLEKKAGVAPPAAGTAPAAEPDDAPASEGFARPEIASGEGEPSEEEVRRFRRIMERAEQLRRDEREMERLNGMLERLEINLDDNQKQKLLTAQRSYRQRVGETWRSAMREGGGREAAQEAMQGLREEFTTEITKFMSIGDAQKITENGAGMMRGWGGRGRDGGGRRAR